MDVDVDKPELEIVSREDLTAAQAAEMLGRTYYAVKNMRQKLRADPKVIALAGHRMPSNATLRGLGQP